MSSRFINFELVEQLVARGLLDFPAPIGGGADAHSNFGYSTVATAPSPATSGTSLTVQAGDGALFPAPPFNAVVWGIGQVPLNTNAEIVRVTAGPPGSSTFTITRGPQAADPGGINRTIVVGDQIACVPTQKVFTDIENYLAPSLQNGVMGSGDCALSAVSVSVAGVITYTLAAANPMWINNASSILVPVKFAGVSAGTLTPGTLPASGQYRGYGIEVDTLGAVSLSTGTDQASQASALSNINTIPAAGKIRVGDIVLLNTAGSYSLSITRDRRPWARGATGGAIDTIATTQSIPNATWTPVTGIQFRMELTGVPVQVSAGLYGTLSAAGPAWVNGYVEGAASGPMQSQVIMSTTLVAARSSWLAPGGLGLTGSHLFTLNTYIPTGTGTLNGTGACSLYVKEMVAQNANNGAV